MRSKPVIRLRWPVGVAVLASAIAVGACEAVLSLGDLQSCDDCLGSQCPAPCAADGATIAFADAAVADTGSTNDGQDAVASPMPDAGMDAMLVTSGGDGGPVSRVDLGLGSLDGGSYAWSKTWTTSEVNAVVVDSAGNTIVTGPLTGSVTFDDAGTLMPPNNKSDQIFVTKLDPNGTILWTKSFGGTGFDSRGAGLAVDPANAIYVAGDFAGGSITFTSGVDGGPVSGISVTGAGARSGLLFKLDASGTPQWARSFLSPNDTSFKCADVAFNGTGTAAVVGLACQFDGTAVTTSGLSGYFPNHDALPDGGGSDAGLDGIFLLVNSTTGAVAHGNTFGAPNETDTLTGIAPIGASGFVAVGNSNGGSPTQGLVPDAGVTWQHVGPEGRTNGFVIGISGGSALWGRPYGDATDGGGVVGFSSVSSQPSSNTMVIGGYLTQGPDLGLGTGSLMPDGYAGFCLGATLSQNPVTSFVQMFNGYPDGGNEVSGVAAGPVFGGGTCAGQLVGPDDSTGDIDLASPPAAQVGGFVAELATKGKLEWAHELSPTTASITGGPNFVKVLGVAVAPNGGIRLVGTFRGDVDLPNGVTWSTALLPGGSAFVLAIGP